MKRPGTAILILSAMTAVAFLATVAYSDTEGTRLGLDGAWKLERHENLAVYLKASGAPWWQRKLARLGGSKMRQTIMQDGHRFEVTSQSPVETRTLQLVADGATEFSAETGSHGMTTWIARVEGTALVVDVRSDVTHRKVRREIVDGMMVMTVYDHDADSQCKFFFERAKAD